jgi:hypothetical protein
LLQGKIAIKILRKLTGDFIKLKVHETANVQIITQPITDSGKAKTGKIWFEGRRLRCMNELNLVSDEFDFFSETKESQIRILKDFLKQSYNYVQKIKA